MEFCVNEHRIAAQYARNNLQSEDTETMATPPLFICRPIRKGIKSGKPRRGGSGWCGETRLRGSSEVTREKRVMSEEVAAREVVIAPQGSETVHGLGEQLGGSGLESTGRLTHFVATNLEEQIRLSASTSSGCQIPAVDPQALQDLAAVAVQVAANVDDLLRNVHGALQAMTALSVGCIHTYRDGVDSLGEAVDTSIRSMYTLMARCEELDREMQPVPALARRIRDMKSALEKLEGLCK